MSIIKLSRISNKSKTSGPVITGITTFTGTQSARLPIGDNSERVGIESGSLRYNDTAGLLEFYDGETWNFIIPAEESANALGVFGGGYQQTPSLTAISSMEYITFSTLGDGKDFGNLTQARCNYSSGACSSNTRGVFTGGYDVPAFSNLNTIDYITISTKGNATDFGDLATRSWIPSSCSSTTRGVISGGGSNAIEYITITTTGNTNTFGNLTSYSPEYAAACSSSTRGIFSGGSGGSPNQVLNVIQYITIASQGTNGTTFGELARRTYTHGGCSSSTRGIFTAGNSNLYPAVGEVNDAQYITIATTGNSQDFGDLLSNHRTACSSSTRAVVGEYGYYEYITIATLGNSQYFGETLYFTNDEGYGKSACSNNHGGLL
jgi:hypothetical protein